MQGLLDPLPQLETLEGGPHSQLLQVLGVFWTTYCFSPAVTLLLVLSTSCPPPDNPRVLTRSEMAPARQRRRPQALSAPPLQPC